jgi:pilus assembly protein CpaF
MFSIIISEKGGAERREAFDKTEINVGRVQGNDLMLPKGNVSKRHARLLFRDGRFIVTDLKSTNGTYVNGRKIAQATIVREGDKIYIGDFVIRIELSAEAGAAPAPDVPSDSPPQEEGSGRGAAPLPGAPTAGPPPLHPAPQPPAFPPQPPALSGMAASSAMQPPAPIPPAPLPPQGSAMQPAPPAPMQPADRAAAMGPPPLGRSPSVRETAMGPGPGAPPIVAPAPIAPAPIAPAPIAPAPIAPAPVAPAPIAPAPIAPAPVAPAPVAPAPVAPAPIAPAPIAPAPIAPAPAPIAAAPAPPPLVAPPPPPFTPPAAVTPLPAADDAKPTAPPAPFVPPAAVTPAVGAPLPSQPPAPSVVPSAPVTAPPAVGSMPAPSSPQPPRSSVRSAAASEGLVDPSAAASHRVALAKLVERTSLAVDLGPLASGEAPSPPLLAAIERALSEKAAALRASGDLPPGLESEVLLAEARRELFELGPVGPLLEDEYVEEVQVIRHDHIVALHAQKQVATEIAFTSEAAVARLVRRLAIKAGAPLGANELFVERRLDASVGAGGARLFGVLPPASGDAHMLVFRKPQRALSTLDDLVRIGMVSRQMATLFSHAVQGRANVLVTGGTGAGAGVLLGALAACGSLDDRVVLLQEDDELVLNQPHAISMLIGDTAESGARSVHAAIRVRPDRLVIGAFAGHIVPEIVDAVGDGLDGVLAAARAPTLRHLTTRLPADMAATRKGITVDVAREWLASAFDLVVEVGRLRDGRQRVTRVAEFAQAGPNALELREIFNFTVERTAAGGLVEGSFNATGVVPRLADDLTARGVAIDRSIFKR